MITVKNLTKRYGDVNALTGISFSIQKGEVVGLLGPNGAGKTTTLKILTCFIAGSSGESSIGGFDCFEQSDEARSLVGYLPENNPLYEEMNVVEYLRFAAEMHGVPKDDQQKSIRKVLKECALEEKAFYSIAELSKGFKQRVGIAAALIHDPKVLILDEPTTGLDPNQVLEIRNLIKKLGKEKTLIVSTHVLSEVEATCSRVIIIDKGTIVATGSPNELKGKATGELKIKVVLAGSKSKTEQMLKTLEGITKVSELQTAKRGEVAFEIYSKAKTDIREALFDTVVKNNMKLLELTPQEASLEDIFASVTK